MKYYITFFMFCFIIVGIMGLIASWLCTNVGFVITLLIFTALLMFYLDYNFE